MIAPMAPAHQLGRHVRLERAFNVRDLGGLPTRDGRRLRWRRVWRADALHELGRDDLLAARDLGWRDVIDVRTLTEVNRTGTIDEVALGVSVHHLPLPPATWGQDLPLPVERSAAFLADRYREMLQVGRAAIVEAVRVLARGRRVVVQGATGKDRTGVVTAVLLGALGVARDEIVHDYSLSAAGTARMAAWLREHAPDAFDALRVRPEAFLDAPPEAIGRTLDDLDAMGGAEGYLVAAGLRSDELAELRRVLLEG